MRQIVKDYSAITELPQTALVPIGGSMAPKELVFHILADNAQQVQVLDIGFGEGQLAHVIKNNEATRHWSVDGIDGLEANCLSRALIDQKVYRNIWHGLAQEIPADVFRQYKILCLLDVIEHLNAHTARWLLHTLLSSMADDAFLFVSTPLWFYPQDHKQQGDLEEHLIGVPVTSMMALIPKLFAINHPLVGGFVYTKQSLDFIEFFQPTPDRSFSFDRGLRMLQALGMPYQPGIMYRPG